MRVRISAQLDLRSCFSRKHQHNEVLAKLVIGDFVSFVLPVEYDITASWKIEDETFLRQVGARRLMDGYRPLGSLPVAQELLFRCMDITEADYTTITLTSAHEKVKRTVGVSFAIEPLIPGDLYSREFKLVESNDSVLLSSQAI